MHSRESATWKCNEDFVHGKKDASDVCRCVREPQDFFKVMVTCVDHRRKAVKVVDGFSRVITVGTWCYYVKECGGVMDRVIYCDASCSFFWFWSGAAMDTWISLSASPRLWNCWVSTLPILFLIYTIRRFFHDCYKIFIYYILFSS